MAKTYLIIGASSGIGFQIAKTLSEDGNIVYAVARKERELSTLSNTTFVPFNVVSDESFSLDLDSLDGFAYCPGTINLKPFHRLSKDDFLSDFNVNVLGSISILQSILPALKRGSNPSIVFFSTVAVSQGMGFHSSIAASKGAVEGLTKSLAAEFAPIIRVNCIAPSITDTSLAERLLSSEEKKLASGKKHPIQRVGNVEDMANMAQFLLSEKSGWITGQVLSVDGGMSSVRML